MDPKFRIGKSIHVSYTRKDIMEDNYSNLWSKADTLANKLVNLQEKVIGLLLEANRLLPSRVEALKDEEAQANFLIYIRLRALYAFAEKLWKVIEEQSRKLAEATSHQYHLDIEDAEEALEETLNIAYAIPFEELIDRNEYGLLELFEIRSQFKPDIEDPVVLYKGGMFSDIVEEYKSGKLMCDYWLRIAIADEYPTKSNIGNLLDDD